MTENWTDDEREREEPEVSREVDEVPGLNPQSYCEPGKFLSLQLSAPFLAPRLQVSMATARVSTSFRRRWEAL